MSTISRWKRKMKSILIIFGQKLQEDSVIHRGRLESQYLPNLQISLNELSGISGQFKPKVLVR